MEVQEGVGGWEKPSTISLRSSEHPATQVEEETSGETCGELLLPLGLQPSVQWWAYGCYWSRGSAIGKNTWTQNENEDKLGLIVTIPYHSNLWEVRTPVSLLPSKCYAHSSSGQL